MLDEDNFVFVDRIGRVHLGGGTTVVCGTEAYRRHLFMLRVYCGLIFSRSSVRPLCPIAPPPSLPWPPCHVLVHHTSYWSWLLGP